jgi:hypothetical protein
MLHDLAYPFPEGHEGDWISYPSQVVGSAATLLPQIPGGSL